MLALEAADDFPFTEAFSSASLEVGVRGLVAPHSRQGDDVESAVGLTVFAAAEPVGPRGAAATGRLRSEPADRSFED